MTTPPTISDAARELAEMANECCHRSDGYEEDMAIKIQCALDAAKAEALAGIITIPDCDICHKPQKELGCLSLNIGVPDKDGFFQGLKTHVCVECDTQLSSGEAKISTIQPQAAQINKMMIVLEEITLNGIANHEKGVAEIPYDIFKTAALLTKIPHEVKTYIPPTDGGANG